MYVQVLKVVIVFYSCSPLSFSFLEIRCVEMEKEQVLIEIEG